MPPEIEQLYLQRLESGLPVVTWIGGAFYVAMLAASVALYRQISWGGPAFALAFACALATSAFGLPQLMTSSVEYALDTLNTLTIGAILMWLLIDRSRTSASDPSANDPSF